MTETRLSLDSTELRVLRTPRLRRSSSSDPPEQGREKKDLLTARQYLLARNDLRVKHFEPFDNSDDDRDQPRTPAAIYWDAFLQSGSCNEAGGGRPHNPYRPRGVSDCNRVRTGDRQGTCPDFGPDWLHRESPVSAVHARCD